MDIKNNTKATKPKTNLPPELMRFLATLLTVLAVGATASAAEIYNAKVVEYFEETIGSTDCAYAGVDTDDDGFADMIIIIEPLDVMIYRRLANFIKQIKLVSYEDSRKIYDRELGNYTIGARYILEVGGKSVLEIFPGKRADFPAEAARQARLLSEAAEPSKRQPHQQSMLYREDKSYKLLLTKARSRKEIGLTLSGALSSNYYITRVPSLRVSRETYPPPLLLPALSSFVTCYLLIVTFFKQPHRPGLPFLSRFQYQPLNFRPVVGAGAGQAAVGGVAENYGFTALSP